MNTAIIVAAGSGTRFGGEIPKQFVEIDGKPLLIHTLEKFENCAAIDEITVVLAANEIEKFRVILNSFNLQKIVKLVAGGNSRAASVLNGLNSLNAAVTEIVAVHDGARPFVSIAEIALTVEKAAETGASCLVGKVTDTIKKVANGKITGTINRESLRRALTPQTFRYEILRRAYDENEIGESATDECSLVENLGIEITCVEGSAKNIKVTHREDLEFGI